MVQIPTAPLGFQLGAGCAAVGHLRRHGSLGGLVRGRGSADPEGIGSATRHGDEPQGSGAGLGHEPGWLMVVLSHGNIMGNIIKGPSIYQISIDIDIGLMGFSPTNGVISSDDDLARKEHRDVTRFHEQGLFFMGI